MSKERKTMDIYKVLEQWHSKSTYHLTATSAAERVIFLQEKSDKGLLNPVALSLAISKLNLNKDKQYLGIYVSKRRAT